MSLTRNPRAIMISGLCLALFSMNVEADTEDSP
jgi:hypothetical protein